MTGLVGERRPPAADSVLELVRRQAKARPDAVAVVDAAGPTTFGDLWLRVATLAATLGEAGAGPGDLVAIMADRSTETVATMLAAWAVRAGYVPIDPTNPAERTRAVLAGAAPRVVLHHGHTVSGLPTVDTAAVPTRADPPSVAQPRPDDVAYVVFTSGSTGAPKGVQVEHRSLVNYVGWSASLTGLAGWGSALFASLGFDLALTTLWTPLAHGLAVLAVGNSWDYASVFAARAEPHAFLKVTPSHARLIERLLRPDYRAATTTLMLGGEPLAPSLIAGMADRLVGVRLINHYGPTETTIGCCANVFHAEAVPDLPSVPIGWPAWNTTAHVLDDRGRPGTHGELVISGTPVARGYLGHGGDAFFDARDIGGTGRAYRTGDIVEVRPEGLLHLGRSDDQLKVNGHRVELAELTSAFLGLPGIVDVAFETTRTAAADHIDAFVVLADGPRGFDAAEERLLRQHLSAVLLPALVPRRIHAVPEIVCNANGKRDIPATRRLATDPAVATPGRPHTG